MKKKTEFVVKTNVSVLCLYLSLELKEMIRKRKEKKLVKSKRKVSCFGCHFKIKNFTMSTCLLLLLLCPPKYDYTFLNFFVKKIVFTKKNSIIHMSRNYNPSSSCRRLLSILSPLPLIAAMSSTYICIIKKIPFSADQKHGNIFPFSRILTSNIYALSLNPPKVEEKSTWTT